MSTNLYDSNIMTTIWIKVHRLWIKLLTFAKITALCKKPKRIEFLSEWDVCVVKKKVIKVKALKYLI